MKRLIPLLLAAAMLLTLAGCSRAVGGVYKLDYITADGMRFSPSSFGMNITLRLEKDGTGTADYAGALREITWTDKGGTLELEGPDGKLSFTKEGKSLLLHSDGTLLFFNPLEEDD